MPALSPRYFCISPRTLSSKTLNNFKYEIALQRHKDENFKMIIKNITRFYVHHHLLPPNSLQRPKNGEPPELENYYHPNPSRAKKKGLTEICKCSSTFHGRSLITPPLFSIIAAVLAIIIAYRDQRDVRLPEQSNDFFFFFEPLSLRRRLLRQSLADLTCPSEQTHSPHLISHSCAVELSQDELKRPPTSAITRLRWQTFSHLIT